MAVEEDGSLYHPVILVRFFYPPPPPREPRHIRSANTSQVTVEHILNVMSLNIRWKWEKRRCRAQFDNYFPTCNLTTLA
jgi:hypothetical protein